MEFTAKQCIFINLVGKLSTLSN